MPKAGGSLSTVHTGAITQLNAASNGKVYYTENGNLYEVSADIDAPTLLASGVSVASATIDSTAFYWADTISGTISRVELNSTLIVFRYPVGPQGWFFGSHFESIPKPIRSNSRTITRHVPP